MNTLPLFPTYQECLNFTKNLLSHHLSIFFRTPYSPTSDSGGDYYTVVQRPMDLTTVRNQLLNNQYISQSQWFADMKLIFDNAILYNGESHVLGSLAKYFIKKLNKFQSNLDILNSRNYEQKVRELKDAFLEHLKKMPVPKSFETGENNEQSNDQYIHPFTDLSFNKIDFDKNRIRNIRNSLNQLCEVGQGAQILYCIHKSSPEFKFVSPQNIDIALLGKNTLIQLENFIENNQKLLVNTIQTAVDQAESQEQPQISQPLESSTT